MEGLVLLVTAAIAAPVVGAITGFVIGWRKK